MKEIINKLIENGYEAYVVGGFVRDYLLGISSKDIDICTNAPISKIKKIFDGRGKAYDKFYAYHIDENGFSYDINTYRKESKYRKNKPTELQIAEDLETDLLRRDFTINTFALDINGKLIDLLGAKKDLSNKVIKVVGNTTKKFNEDKTRIIRAIRFACTLDFKLDEEIVNFITKRKTFLLSEVPKEFIKKELDKIFESNGIDRFFKMIKEYNINKYFDISYNEIKSTTYNRYGIWAQIETTLPLSKKEQDIIKSIKSLVNKKDITYLDFNLYSDDVVFNAANILGLESKCRAYKEIEAIRSIIDINADPDLFVKYAGYANLKKAYKLVEKSIIEGNLSNNKDSIEMFLRNIKLWVIWEKYLKLEIL